MTMAGMKRRGPVIRPVGYPKIERPQYRKRKRSMRKYNANIIELSPELVSSLNETNCGLPDGRYVPARPIGFQSLGRRIKATWLVWTGRADALIWPGQ